MDPLRFDKVIVPPSLPCAIQCHLQLQLMQHKQVYDSATNNKGRCLLCSAWKSIIVSIHTQPTCAHLYRKTIDQSVSNSRVFPESTNLEFSISYQYPTNQSSGLSGYFCHQHPRPLHSLWSQIPSGLSYSLLPARTGYTAGGKPVAKDDFLVPRPNFGLRLIH